MSKPLTPPPPPPNPHSSDAGQVGRTEQFESLIKGEVSQVYDPHLSPLPPPPYTLIPHPPAASTKAFAALIERMGLPVSEQEVLPGAQSPQNISWRSAVDARFGGPCLRGGFFLILVREWTCFLWRGGIGPIVWRRQWSREEATFCHHLNTSLLRDQGKFKPQAEVVKWRSEFGGTKSGCFVVKTCKKYRWLKIMLEKNKKINNK